MTHTWRIARIAGIDVRIDASWLLIALVIGYTFFLRFDELFPEESGRPLVLVATLSAIVFFSSVLVHELAHALVARARGVEVHDITLFVFGGATRARVDEHGPGSEFLIAVVGPLTSLAVAAVLAAVSIAVGSSGDLVPGALGYLAWLNAALAVFNLLPGLPLDGGRLLRSALWRATGDLDRATQVAGAAGQVLGYTLVALGLVTLFAGSVGGIWLAAIGWFLAQSALASTTVTHARIVLADVEAREVMTRDLITVPAGLTVAAAVDQYFLGHDHAAYPVERDGHRVGLLTLRRVRRMTPDERARTTVADAMTPVAELDTVAPDTAMDTVLAAFDEEHNRVVVVERDEVVGLIAPTDVNHWLARWHTLQRARHIPPPR